RKSPPATPLAGPGRHSDFLVDPLVGHETIGIERAARRRFAHPAAGLGEMPAVVEAALVEEGPEFDERGAQPLGVERPRAHLAQPRRVHDIAPRGDGHDEGGAGRVLARVPLRADFADAEVQARVERVQEAGFPDARLTGEHRLAPAQEVAQRYETLRLSDRGPEHLVARRTIPPLQGVERTPVEIDLVEDEHRGNAVRRRDNQESIEHAGPGSGLRADATTTTWSTLAAISCARGLRSPAARRASTLLRGRTAEMVACPSACSSSSTTSP